MENPNITYLDAIAGDDANFRKRFISILKDEFPQEFLEYKIRFEEKKFKETADVVHKIKHKLNICGMEDGYHFAVKYEEELRKEIGKSHSEFLSFLIVVDEFIKTL